MAQEPQISSPLPLPGEGRPASPGLPGLRNRQIHRAATFNEPLNRLRRRRSSVLSDNMSESRKSFLSSTDNLLLPRPMPETSTENTDETTNWHSAPLGIALLPAVAGLFFKNGSAIVTDITLLGVAGIFLNWSLRLPWEWYRSAQSVTSNDELSSTIPSPIEEPDGVHLADIDEAASDQDESSTIGPRRSAETLVGNTASRQQADARKELRTHELLALFACFVFPLAGAWLLHAIRSQLSRPSEGLVSNYNLTIFLLVAELRPMSHMMTMIQQRTLYLQRRANVDLSSDRPSGDGQSLSDLNSRLSELELHLADQALAVEESSKSSLAVENSETLITRASSQATSEVRKAMQPELDALNRAMRRYEKRMTITAVQVEARLQDLEARLKDVVVLAAAAQRSAEKQPRSYITILTNWICALVVLPIEAFVEALRFPGKCVRSASDWIMKKLKIQRPTRDFRDGKPMAKKPSIRGQSVTKRTK